MRYSERRLEIEDICSTALTFTEVEARLGLTSPNRALRRYIRQTEIPMPLYEGQRFGAGEFRRISEQDLCQNSTVATGPIKRWLIRNGKKNECCEKCGWAEKREDGKVPVELHHINGDSSDNRLENLQILCPNCHSLTMNFAGKNKRNPGRCQQTEKLNRYYLQKRHLCERCGELGFGERFCSNKCYRLASRKVEWPSKEQLANDVANMSWSAIGRKYGVSDNAVRKWAAKLGIEDL